MNLKALAGASYPRVKPRVCAQVCMTGATGSYSSVLKDVSFSSVSECSVLGQSLTQAATILVRWRSVGGADTISRCMRESTPPSVVYDEKSVRAGDSL